MCPPDERGRGSSVCPLPMLLLPASPTQGIFRGGLPPKNGSAAAAPIHGVFEARRRFSWVCSELSSKSAFFTTSHALRSAAFFPRHHSPRKGLRSGQLGTSTVARTSIATEEVLAPDSVCGEPTPPTSSGLRSFISYPKDQTGCPAGWGKRFCNMFCTCIRMVFSSAKRCARRCCTVRAASFSSAAAPIAASATPPPAGCARCARLPALVCTCTEEGLLWTASGGLPGGVVSAPRASVIQGRQATMPGSGGPSSFVAAPPTACGVSAGGDGESPPPVRGGAAWASSSSSFGSRKARR